MADRYLLRDIAPYPAEEEDVTALGLAKHFAAAALMHHRSQAGKQAGALWLLAQTRAEGGFAGALLLRTLHEQCGADVTDVVARLVWATREFRSVELADQLTGLVRELGIDPNHPLLGGSNAPTS